GVTAESVLLENCVDTHPFRDPAHPRSREEFGFPGDSVVFCYLGRIGAEKNMELLTDAVVMAARDVPEIHLLVLGDGPLMAQTRTRLSEAGLDDRVHFAGLTPYAEVPGCLAAADVFVTASISETYPLVVMEAAAAGLPAIGVRSPGIEDIIEDGVTGYLVPEDADAFAARMRELARDAMARGRMSQAARAAADRFDIRVKADEMLGHYRRLIEERRSGDRTAAGSS
ncbi:MAG TPA: glycosyltransferase, partial [Coriobacteriia bacterium]|nr:glycosyltransferase [Coriobacteriia bacterium]